MNMRAIAKAGGRAVPGIEATPSILRRAVGVALPAVALALWAGVAPLEGQAPSGEEARRAIAGLLTRAAEHGFAGQVLAVRQGERLFYAGVGLADPEARVPVDTGTVFAIGSVTKQFTRVAILLLEQRGLLSTPDAIARHLEDVPPDKAGVTIADLLAMRAGFQEYHDDTGDHQPMTRDEALARILSQELLFEPGTGRAYSNSGYTLLAAIIESVTGASYTEFVRHELIEPTGMTSTGFHGDDRWEDRRVARGRGPARFGDNAPDRWPPVTWALMGAGGMVSSASDLATWIRALRAGDVLGPTALAKAYPVDVSYARYAGADDYGFQTGVIELDDGRDVTIVNACSGDDALALAARVAEVMTGTLLPFELPRPEVGTGTVRTGPPPGAAGSVPATRPGA